MGNTSSKNRGFSMVPIYKGRPGWSAYQIAVQHGFAGTEDQWLASLTATVTKAAVESVLTGSITSHSHPVTIDAVPYLGADKDVDLGNNWLYSDGIHIDGFTVDPPEGIGLTLSYFTGLSAAILAYDWDLVTTIPLVIEANDIDIIGYDNQFVGRSILIDADHLTLAGEMDLAIEGDVSMTDTLSVGGSLSLPYRAINAIRTLDETDYQIECTANTFDITLPSAIDITGRVYSIKNSGVGVITIKCDGAETIDGEVSQEISQWENIMMVSNGANWIII